MRHRTRRSSGTSLGPQGSLSHRDRVVVGPYQSRKLFLHPMAAADWLVAIFPRSSATVEVDGANGDFHAQNPMTLPCMGKPNNQRYAAASSPAPAPSVSKFLGVCRRRTKRRQWAIY
ncbi:hypothetical protein DACRYDRAFT_23906 [Dacryopinax primogenitus]|uniref:Uncharacterized protein n=1 Tax=Dacryopinax primogenitus (strain DJM 731) TaxID=1858805 RepID=M5FUX4_DACPD|nr:uncharacterized protein DACRYDRAFT_23906 [Dacryopinax primogenitus]EJT99339.1 hypothetical protein DACRYDRAFT_23906 [Dacryopinax primogenitus]